MTDPRRILGVCPAPPTDQTVMSYHGTGGKRSRHMIESVFRTAFAENADNTWQPLVDGTSHDSALFDLPSSRVAMTTDAYVVSPLFFPGGNIGMLSVHGSVNDLAMVGASARALTASFILEEGLPLDDLRRIVHSMAQAARETGVRLVAGDTKVVEKGRGDGVYISTTALGVQLAAPPWQPTRIRPGNVILVSGDVGRHGIAVLGARAALEFTALDGSALASDVTNLWPRVATLLDLSNSVACLRDLTRGGLGSVLLELSEQSGLPFEITTTSIPVCGTVASACELLGLDPLYVACEGRFVAITTAERAPEVLSRLRSFDPMAAAVGTVCAPGKPQVHAVGPYGSRRLLDGHGADQLPRIC